MMKNGLIAAFLALLWGFSPTWAAAAEDAGNADAGDFALINVQDLIDLCTVPEGHELSNQGAYFCMGYATGAIQYHNALAAGKNGKRIICPDPNVNRLELIEAFVDWARAHPKNKSESAIEGFAAAAVGKWPCA